MRRAAPMRRGQVERPTAPHLGLVLACFAHRGLFWKVSKSEQRRRLLKRMFDNRRFANGSFR
jgi:hypothetical protein